MNGTYDVEGYKPGERERIAKAHARQTKGSDPMAKKTTRRAEQKPKPTAKRRKWTAQRINTIPSNGGSPESREAAPEKIPIGEAMRRAVEALGDVTIDPELAAGQLRELAALYENVAAEQAAYDAKAEEAKIAKKALESTTTLLLEQVRAFTHAKALPLFDQAQAEEDRSAMISAGDAPEGMSADG